MATLRELLGRITKAASEEEDTTIVKVSEDEQTVQDKTEEEYVVEAFENVMKSEQSTEMEKKAAELLVSTIEKAKAEKEMLLKQSREDMLKFAEELGYALMKGINKAAEDMPNIAEQGQAVEPQQTSLQDVVAKAEQMAAEEAPESAEAITAPAEGADPASVAKATAEGAVSGIADVVESAIQASKDVVSETAQEAAAPEAVAAPQGTANDVLNQLQAQVQQPQPQPDLSQMVGPVNPAAVNEAIKQAEEEAAAAAAEEAIKDIPVTTPGEGIEIPDEVIDEAAEEIANEAAEQAPDEVQDEVKEEVKEKVKEELSDVDNIAEEVANKIVNSEEEESDEVAGNLEKMVG